MELVLFEDGRYGIKRKRFFGLYNEYLDLDNKLMWWSCKDSVNAWCKKSNKETVLNIYKLCQEENNSLKHITISNLPE